MTTRMYRRNSGLIVPSTTAVSTFGPHLFDWWRQPGDQAIIVPDGTTLDTQNMDITNNALVHPSTNGSQKGWLVVLAQSFLGSTIDLSGLSLNLQGTSQGGANPRRQLRIITGGFRIINGQIKQRYIEKLWWYYCDATFPALTWDAQYRAAYFSLHGVMPNYGDNIDFNAINNMTNDHCQINSGDQTADNRWYFSDFHDIGDDATQISGSDGWVFESCRSMNVYHHGVNYFNTANGNAYSHSDFFQGQGGVTNTLFNNCSIMGHIDLETTPGGGSCTFTLTNSWDYGSDHFGITLAEEGGHHIIGTVKNVLWFAHFQYNGTNDGSLPNADYQDTPLYNLAKYGTYTIGAQTLGFNDRIAYGFTAANPNGTVNGPAGVSWLDGTNTNIGLVAANTAWHGYPSGVGQDANGILTPDLAGFPTAPYPDTPTVNDHVDNPAVISRAANAYANWAAYFAGKYN